MKLNIEKLKTIENSFFDIDKDTNTAKVILQYDHIKDIMEPGYVSAMPVLNDDFLSCIWKIFERVSPKYMVDLTIRFGDMGGYSEEQALEITRENLTLELKRRIMTNHRKNKVGFSLIVIGVVCFFAMILIKHMWHTESILEDLFFYMLDILATVTIWQAFTILIIDKREMRVMRKNITNRLAALHLEEI